MTSGNDFRQSQIRIILEPAILFSRVCGVLPRFLQGKDLSKKKCYNLTFPNWFILSLMFIYTSTLCIRLSFIIIGQENVKFVVVFSYLLSIPSGLKMSFYFFFILKNQKELEKVLTKLECFLKTKPEINARKIKGILYFMILVTLMIILQLVILEPYRVCQLSKPLLFKYSLNTGAGIVSDNLQIQQLYIILQVIIFSLFFHILPYIVHFFFLTMIIIFKECLKANFHESQNMQFLTTADLFQLMQNHKQLLVIFRRFNRFYSKILLGFYGSMTAIIVAGFPVLIDYHKTYSVIHFVYLYGIIYAAWLLVSFTFVASDIQLTFDDIQANLLEKIDEERHINMSLCLEKMQILSNLADMKLEIKVWGFFTVDRKLLLTVLVNTITLVVIVVQITPTLN